MSDSVWPHRWKPTRVPHPWDSPGKNTGVGCHFLLQCMKMKTESEVAQSCPTLNDPMDCSPPGSSIYGIFQARVLEWGTIAFSNAWKWKVKVKSCPTLSDPMDCSLPGSSLSMGFSRQEYWSGVPLPSLLTWFMNPWIPCDSPLPRQFHPASSHCMLSSYLPVIYLVICSTKRYFPAEKTLVAGNLMNILNQFQFYDLFLLGKLNYVI